jgi:hypothetical protein
MEVFEFRLSETTNRAARFRLSVDEPHNSSSRLIVCVCLLHVIDTKLDVVQMPVG